VVGFDVSENPFFDGLPRSFGVGDPASSPASPTKETVERLSLFSQSILAKTVKTPDFLRKNRKTGFFYVFGVIVSYL
jgi:hypothetical protein